ncbi:hypothetical protein BLA29_013264 [Euroglyphus maynei]|uniref:Uncharacterized protein n=1 Tax=Euroglyphus maynei TaxID=6958 RepID=A0A1Y3ANC7_EURMA|nr:hypothetical protein BLA29_013264 [Euroglyphus maynei]
MIVGGDGESVRIDGNGCSGLDKFDFLTDKIDAGGGGGGGGGGGTCCS